MPLWDIMELQIAANDLDLVMDHPDVDVESEDIETVAELVEYHYYIFGGVARECLSTEATLLNDRERWIEETITRFTAVNEIRSVLNGSEGEETRIRLCHYTPDPTDITEYVVAESSVFVKRLLVESLSKLTPDKRSEVVKYLRSFSVATSFRGTIFTLKVHEKLRSGCKFTARQLGTTQSKTFKCKKTSLSKEGRRYSFGSHKSDSVLLNGPYHVDSFYYLQSRSSFPRFRKTSANQLLLVPNRSNTRSTCKERRAGIHFGPVWAIGDSDDDF